MSEASSGAGGISLVALCSGLWAYFTTPSLTGLQGVFGAAMIGSGTSLVAGLGAFTLGLAGLALGGAVGGRGGAASCGLIGVFAGAGLGIYHGYGAAKDIVVDGVKPRVEAAQEDASAVGMAEDSFTYETADAAAPKVTVMQPL